MKYALVLVNIKGLGVKTFSYLIPEEMKNIIQVGQAVLVPFGRQGLINAFVVGFSDYVPEDIDVRLGGSATIGKICVIGSNINENALCELFKI